MTAVLLYENDDGRYLVACAGSTLVAGNPSWHRSFPIQVDPALFAPAVGQPWPRIAGSLYAGIAAGEGGAPPGHIVLLPDEPSSRLNWQSAVAWAEGLGNGARLPTRTESTLLYANVREAFLPEWHWTSEAFDGSYAWGQLFSYGYQNGSHKSYEGRCRAVRRFDAQSFNPSSVAA